MAGLLLGVKLTVALLAFFGRFRPLPLVVGGAFVAAAGGLILIVGGIGSTPSGFVAVSGGVVLDVGLSALIASCVPVLIRQVAPLERMALWLGSSVLAAHVLLTGLRLLPEDGTFALLMTLGTVSIGVALWGTFHAACRGVASR